MHKPQKKIQEYYDYMECQQYLLKKYKVDGKEFWDWLCDLQGISNGSFFSVWPDFPSEGEEIIKYRDLLLEEFGDAESFHVSW